MPVEIRELIIKATIADAEKPEQGGKSKGLEESDKQAIVAECVETVMELLHLKQER